uniref:ATP synthase F0 subunit 8 n=1 Tax=Dinophilus gyrociliatus TaxID=120995 RepID=A0A343TAR4_9ANNE|nr:ATP synthase F0 subunit 8 [Dinophilus gyrociliatus]
MPHLSPLNWFLAIMFFTATLISLSTMTWWKNNYSFPASSSKKTSITSSTWKW